MEVKGTTVTEKPEIIEELEEGLKQDGTSTETMAQIESVLDFVNNALDTALSEIQDTMPDLTPDQMAELRETLLKIPQIDGILKATNEITPEDVTQIREISEMLLTGGAEVMASLEWVYEHEKYLNTMRLPYNSFTTGEPIVDVFMRWNGYIEAAQAGQMSLSKRDLNEMSTAISMYRPLIDAGFGSLSSNQIAAYHEAVDALSKVVEVAPRLFVNAFANMKLTGTPNDDAAIGTMLTNVLKTFIKDPTLREVLNDSPILRNSIASFAMQSLIGTKFDKVRLKYTGEGGFYDRITPIVMLAEIFVTMLQNNVDQQTYDILYRTWPYKSVDGVLFLPTADGVYTYQPNIPGMDVKYFMNLWDAPTNIILKSIDILQKTNLPYTRQLASLANLYDQVGGLTSSFDFGMAVRQQKDFPKLIKEIKLYAQNIAADMINKAKRSVTAPQNGSVTAEEVVPGAAELLLSQQLQEEDSLHGSAIVRPEGSRRTYSTVRKA